MSSPRLFGFFLFVGKPLKEGHGPAEPSTPPNGGPVKSSGDSTVMEGPPSVS
jgi:hypothetical protein